MMETQYFDMAGCPGQFFRCTRLSATLSVDSCASRWKKAQRDRESCRQCVNCPVGASHAGETQTSTSTLLGRPICCRCHRGSDRLVSKHICVSCYNRQREWVLGRNAKGTKPVKQRPLRPIQIAYYADAEIKTIKASLAESATEMIVHVLRHTKQQVTFGFFARAMQ